MRSTATPTSALRSCSSEAVSLTGISSGRETIAVPVWSWSVIRRSSCSACEWIGPTLAIAAKVRGVCRKPIPCPVAGASTITRSYLRPDLTLRSSWASSQILPIVTSSLRPGVAAAR